MTKNSIGKATVTVYKSGNSKVITIPPTISAKVGDKYTLTNKNKKLILEKVNTTEKGALLKGLKRLTGALPNSTKNMDIEKLEKFLEGAYA